MVLNLILSLYKASSVVSAGVVGRRRIVRMVERARGVVLWVWVSRQGVVAVRLFGEVVRVIA